MLSAALSLPGLVFLELLRREDCVQLVIRFILDGLHLGTQLVLGNRTVGAHLSCLLGSFLEHGLDLWLLLRREIESLR